MANVRILTNPATKIPNGVDLACSLFSDPGSTDHFKRDLTELAKFPISREEAFLVGHQTVWSSVL